RTCGWNAAWSEPQHPAPTAHRRGRLARRVNPRLVAGVACTRAPEGAAECRNEPAEPAAGQRASRLRSQLTQIGSGDRANFERVFARRRLAGGDAHFVPARPDELGLPGELGATDALLGFARDQVPDHAVESRLAGAGERA